MFKIPTFYLVFGLMLVLISESQKCNKKFNQKYESHQSYKLHTRINTER